MSGWRSEATLGVLVASWAIASCGGSARASRDAGGDGGGCSCPAARTVECSGRRTHVPLPTPRSVCGEGASDDAPESYALGTSTVRYTPKSGAECTTVVTVKDDEPPTVDCDGLQTVLLTTPGAKASVPLAKATDRCSPDVTVSASPVSVATSGKHAVTYTAKDASGNVATCKATLNARGVYPVTDLRLAHAAIGTGGSTGTVVLWDTPPGSDADGYRIERASASGGPWKSLASVAATATSYADASLSGMVAYYRVVATLGGVDGGVSDPIRALAITASEYDLGVQPIPGFDMPANGANPETMSAPIHGFVRYPTNLVGGPYPLVLLLHGNHGNCRPPDFDPTGTNDNFDDDCFISNDNTCPSGYTPTPNAQGLLGLAETLASRGYVVSSIDANAVNCRQSSSGGEEDGYIGQRTELMIEHMRRWRTWATKGAAPFSALFAKHVDMGHVVVVGHSRGAEAAAEVPQTFATSTDVSGITLAAVFSLAPTNFDDPQPGPLPFSTLVPICDGDVYTYNGVQLYDRRLRLTGAKSAGVQLFMGHADHDHFNDEWVFDDNAIYTQSCTPGTLDTPDMQRRVLEVVVGSWIDETVPPGAVLEPWLHAVGDPPPSVAAYAAGTFPLDLRRSYVSPTVTPIDNFESGSLAQDLLGGAYSSTGGFTDATPAVCTGVSSPVCDDGGGDGWPHYNPADAPPQRSAVAIDWNDASGVFAADLAPASGSYDASPYAALSLRVSARAAATNTTPTGDPIDFEVAIVDAAGHSAAALASEVTTLYDFYPSSIPRAVLQTVRLALPALAARGTPAVDLAHLSRIELRTSAPGQASGAILVSDIELAQ